MNKTNHKAQAQAQRVANNEAQQIIELITAEILGSTVCGLDNIVTAMYYEGVDMSLLNNGRTIYVYGEGTYEIA